MLPIACIRGHSGDIDSDDDEQDHSCQAPETRTPLVHFEHPRGENEHEPRDHHIVEQPLDDLARRSLRAGDQHNDTSDQPHADNGERDTQPL
ncbi:hypothetical protein HRbin27_01734 [bacterium HR27]|nr:hypothetical protein HRbin27_01734 [bacterium HR27]